jgi:hypothetical protein
MLRGSTGQVRGGGREGMLKEGVWADMLLVDACWTNYQWRVEIGPAKCVGFSFGDWLKRNLRRPRGLERLRGWLFCGLKRLGMSYVEG